MPSIEHNGLVEMFRENPELAAHVLERLFAVPVPPHASARVVEGALDQLLPIEFRADLVIEFPDIHGKLVLAVAVEAQLDEDPDKKFTWPVYWAVLRARKRCPVCVLVVAPDTRVAAWAAEPIALGPGPSDSITPAVLGPKVLPVVKDPAVATQEPEIAVLSALAHGNGPDGLAVVSAAFAAVGRFDKKHGDVYLHLIYRALREPIKKALEVLIMQQFAGTEFELPPFAQKLIQRGELKGELKGKLQAKREALLKLVTRAGVVLSQAQRALIDACEEPDTLDQWFDRALAAKNADEIFA